MELSGLDIQFVLIWVVLLGQAAAIQGLAGRDRKQKELITRLMIRTEILASEINVRFP